MEKWPDDCSWVNTYTATIYIGLKNRETNKLCSISTIYKAVQSYVDEIGLCVTVAPTKFYYTNGNEDGVVVGLINYPRFPTSRIEIIKQTIELGRILKKAAKQCRVSIVFPNETVMLGDGKNEKILCQDCYKERNEN